MTPDIITVRQGPHQRLRSHGLRAGEERHLRRLHAGPGRPSSCSTATPIPRIRLPAPPAWRRWKSIEREGLLTRAKTLAPLLGGRGAFLARAAARHRRPQLRTDSRHRAGSRFRARSGARAFEVYLKCFDRGLLVRQTGDILALSPPLIIDGRADRSDLQHASARFSAPPELAAAHSALP